MTGASGQLGAYLVHHLLYKEADVFCLVRPDSNLWRLSDVIDNVTILRADFCDLTLVEETISRTNLEVVFHLGWDGVAGVDRDRPEQITTNVKGSLELFQMLPGTCRCFVGIGSQAEYGPCNQTLTEELPLNAVTAYGISKLCTGLMICKLSALRRMRFVWLRLLATYGPMDDDRHLIPSVIKQILAGKRPALTQGEQKWDYLYIKDAAEAIYKAALNESTAGFYNLCSGKANTVEYIAEYIRNLIDPGLALGFGDIPYGDDGIISLEADCSKLCETIDWKPGTSLEKGLEQTVSWYMRDSRNVP